MSGHTPGPWHVEHGTPTGRRLVADLVEGEQHLTHYRIVHEGEREGDGEADALLIAAAPRYLKALLDIVAAGHDEYEDAETCEYRCRPCCAACIAELAMAGTT